MSGPLMEGRAARQQRLREQRPLLPTDFAPPVDAPCVADNIDFSLNLSAPSAGESFSSWPPAVLAALVGTAARLSRSDNLAIALGLMPSETWADAHWTSLSFDVEGSRTCAEIVSQAKREFADAQAALSGDRSSGGEDGARMQIVAGLDYQDERVMPESTQPVLPDWALHCRLVLLCRAAEGTVRCRFVFDRRRFGASSVRRWAALVARFWQVIGQSSARACTLDAVRLTTPEDLRFVRNCNATAYELSDRRVHELFEEWCDRAPHRLALQIGDTAYSYFDLEQRANRCAHALRRRGVGEAAVVGIALNRDADLVAALLAVLKCGACYLPLDPTLPPARLSFIVQNSAVALVLTCSTFAERLAGTATLLMDAEEIEALPAARLPAPHAKLSVARCYVIYTSGSTGQPKGVQVGHSAAVNLLGSMARLLGFGPEDRWLAMTNLSFDISFAEIFVPLVTGGTVVMGAPDDVFDGAAVQSTIERRGVTIVQATPTAWRLLLETGWRGGQSVQVISGGEPLDLELAHALVQRCKVAWNAYGPTETTVWSTLWRIPPSPAMICVGRPLDNTGVWIIDQQSRACPVGVWGEICIVGAGLALGYCNRAELTQQLFTSLPELEVDRCYRTGDWGRWRSDGLLELAGRMDEQVKILGHRIELGEVRSAVLRHASVADCVVLVDHAGKTDVRLIAYVVLRAGGDAELQGVQHALRDWLPSYMLPQRWVRTERIPLLPSGKVDRRKLQQC